MTMKLFDIWYLWTLYMHMVWYLTHIQSLYWFIDIEWYLYTQWPFQDPIDWRYLPYIRAMYWNIPIEYCVIWYISSIFGSWSSHWSTLGIWSVHPIFLWLFISSKNAVAARNCDLTPEGPQSVSVVGLMRPWHYIQELISQCSRTCPIFCSSLHATRCFLFPSCSRVNFILWVSVTMVEDQCGIAEAL